MCACDTSRENKAVTDELNSAQVTVVHIKGTAKNAADCKLRQSIRTVSYNLKGVRSAAHGPNSAVRECVTSK